MEFKVFAHKIYTGDDVLENQIITCAHGKIKNISSGYQSSADEVVENISASFFDIQLNGGANYHFTANPTEECIADMEASSTLDGVGYLLPTLITSSKDNIFRGIDAIKNYCIQHPKSGVLGMHLEGPFLNPIKRGAHLTKYIQKPNKELIQELIEYANGTILQMTIAPEMFDEYTLKYLLKSGVALAAGHSNATYEEASSAFSLGIQQVTHLFNAMSPFLHRAPGLVGATFDHPDVYAPIVLDGRHVDFAAAKIAHQIKKDKLFLISDALFLRKKKTSFTWEEFDAKLINDEYINSDGNLAGANISLPDAVRNAVNELNLTVKEAVEMATIRPAKALGLSNTIGKLAANYPAKFTLFDNELNHFEVLDLL
ncbi:N-acetylglucosamine-6-phosphate deacetylase [Olivibacter domesticus]|uniref:N-acetylglucosamine-6-phosphate deacetylase n=1 Tax=Olivibacter domesticus TaxID=407022 RepID=A0A1H7M7S8_OLID1|nr:N-acetylglucosamine-6-phosphate deacetylase [Olivibacter domesticus]SEL07149.1 N-acetylglucosamine-6-phosphate deacetylase [Olivibacter domesticus]